MLKCSCFLLTLFLLGLSHGLCGQEKRNNVIFLQDEYCLGTLTNEETVDRKIVIFDYFNETGKKVVIKKVKTSCECISVEYPNRAIRILEKGQLRVLLNLKGIKGAFRRALLVYIEDYPPVLLAVTGEVIVN